MPPPTDNIENYRMTAFYQGMIKNEPAFHHHQDSFSDSNFSLTIMYVMIWFSSSLPTRGWALTCLFSKYSVASSNITGTAMKHTHTHISACYPRQVCTDITSERMGLWDITCNHSTECWGGSGHTSSNTHFGVPRCRPGSPPRAPWKRHRAGWGRAPSRRSRWRSISPSRGGWASPSRRWRVLLWAPDTGNMGKQDYCRQVVCGV